jgi:hypothetical protein
MNNGSVEVAMGFGDGNKQGNILYSLEDGPWSPKHVVIQ